MSYVDYHNGNEYEQFDRDDGGDYDHDDVNKWYVQVGHDYQDSQE